MTDTITPRPKIMSQLRDIAGVFSRGEFFETEGYRRGEKDVAIRFDYELSTDALNEDHGLWHKVIPLTLGTDIEDLLVNGDREHPNDALLKTLDGEKKRGKPFDIVWIPTAQIHRRQDKDRVSYTIYIILSTESH